MSATQATYPWVQRYPSYPFLRTVHVRYISIAQYHYRHTSEGGSAQKPADTSPLTSYYETDTVLFVVDELKVETDSPKASPNLDVSIRENAALDNRESPPLLRAQSL